jgi:ankyrin repeat protein
MGKVSFFKYVAGALVIIICVTLAMDRPPQGGRFLQKKLKEIDPLKTLNILLDNYSKNSLNKQLSEKIIDEIVVLIKQHPQLAQKAINISGNGDSLLIWLAIFDTYAPLVQKLFDSNVNMNVNFKNAHYDTAFTVAVRNGNVTIIQRLLDFGVDVNQQQASNGDTPLMEAIRKLQFSAWYPRSVPNYLKTIELLLEAGADATLKNKHKETVFDLAANNPQILELLNKYKKEKIK